MKKYIIVLLLIIPFFAQGQSWKRYRREYVYAFGVTNVLSDLGGANQIGTHFLKDFEWPATRGIGTFAYRYRIDRHHTVYGSISAGWLYMSDAFTQEHYRNTRNIIVRTPVVEVSGRYEYFINKEKEGRRYNIRHAKGIKNFTLHTYGFAGIGVFYYQPQGLYTDGSWYNLRRLSTEGQGMPGGANKYSPVSICFPVGIGARYALTRLLSIGLEFGQRYTLTNYIDDTGGKYYSYNAILKEKGPVAAYFSDPSGHNGAWDGEVRGKKDFDTYMFIQATLSQKIAPKRTKAKF
ncbi:MAG: hypothetical protein IT239_02425 [Bacteroidia bacterium]|nr:hypothetical protein [Bacteroidia bacterium]